MSKVKVARGRSFAVAAGETSAARAAADMLKRGGNIADAAIAGAAVLSVVLPYACGLGGDLFLLYWDARERRCHVLNASGASPHAVEAGMKVPETGVQSVSVPAMVAGWCDFVARFGSKPLAEILAPAIRLARDGFPAHAGLIHNIRSQQKLLHQDAEAQRLFFADGEVPALGELVRQTDLAASLDMIAAEGAAAFYRGPLAGAMAAHIRDSGGFLAMHDLEQHASLWCDPLETSYRGHTVLAAPPNNPGILLQLHLAARQRQAPSDRAAADIETWLAAREAAGDLVQDSRQAEARARALLKDVESGAVSLEHGVPGESMPGPSHTSSLAIMDAAGNAVSLIQSVASPFGSGVVVPATGIVLNNRMQGFWSPGDGDASLASGKVPVLPGKRPPHSLCPALVCKDGQVTMALGTPGHLGQTASVAQVIQQVYGRGVFLPDAVAGPRWTLGYDGSILYEKGFARDRDRADLAALGAKETNSGDLRFGSVKAVSRDDDGLAAVADFRRVADVAAG